MKVMTPERLYTSLLALYPKPFRDEYGDDMLAAFRGMRRANSRPPFAFWRFVAVDLVRSAGREQLAACRTGPRRFAVRWLAICAIGIVVTSMVANVATWTFQYFYHPYFEGLTLLPSVYGACLGLVLGGTVGAGQWMLLPAAVRRARSWMLASAVALPVAVLFCGTAIERVLLGVNPLAAHSDPDVLRALISGLDRATDWTGLTLQFGAMAASGLVARALIVRPLMVRPFVERYHAH